MLPYMYLSCLFYWRFMTLELRQFDSSWYKSQGSKLGKIIVDTILFIHIADTM